MSDSVYTMQPVVKAVASCKRSIRGNVRGGTFRSAVVWFRVCTVLYCAVCSTFSLYTSLRVNAWELRVTVVKPLQYFCRTLPLPYLLHQRKLLFWKKLHCSDSAVLQSLSRRMHQAFVAVGSWYNVLSPRLSNSSVRELIWNSFAMSVDFVIYVIISVCFLRF